MAEKNVEELKKRFQELNDTYQEKFAGKNRAQLSPEDMDAFLDKARAMLKVYNDAGVDEGAAGELKAQLEAMIQTSERETELIRAAKDAGPEFERFAMCGAEANLAFAKYSRHFAGQARDTRDLGLAQELVEDLKKIRQRMQAIAGKKPPAAMAKDLDLVSGSLETYQVELTEIPKAQASGTPEEQADRLANLANTQFALYASHFAGKSRLTRRPAMLKRVLDNLKRIKSQMLALKSGGLGAESNNNNITTVDGRIKAYEKELDEIRKVRKGVKLVDIMSALGGAANELFEEYRKDFAEKDRKTVSLPQIVLLADQLDEIHRQMADMGRVEKNEVNDKNQRVVFEHLSTWNREHDAIRSAQSE